MPVWIQAGFGIFAEWGGVIRPFSDCRDTNQRGQCRPHRVAQVNRAFFILAGMIAGKAEDGHLGQFFVQLHAVQQVGHAVRDRESRILKDVRSWQQWVVETAVFRA